MCRSHGGAARQVQDAARERLAAMVLPALAVMRKLLDSGESDAVKLATCRDILDRCGYKVPEKIETTGDTRITVEYVDSPLPGAQKAPNGHLTTTRN